MLLFGLILINFMKDTNLELFLSGLMQPNSDISGNSICPFLKEYSIYLRYMHVDSIDEIVKNNKFIIPQLYDHEGSSFIYVIHSDVTYNDIVKLREQEQINYKDEDIEFLFLLKNDKSQPPLTILKNYSYKNNTLFVLQRKSTLKSSRNVLAKTTNYYEYWKK